MTIATPLKKVTPSFPGTPSESWGPVKSFLFENLVGGSTAPPPTHLRKGGIHTIRWGLVYPFSITMPVKLSNKWHSRDWITQVVSSHCLVATQHYPQANEQVIWRDLIGYCYIKVIFIAFILFCYHLTKLHSIFTKQTWLKHM